jgi:hypothetical protein
MKHTAEEYARALAERVGMAGTEVAPDELKWCDTVRAVQLPDRHMLIDGVRSLGDGWWVNERDQCLSLRFAVYEDVDGAECVDAELYDTGPVQFGEHGLLTSFSLHEFGNGMGRQLDALSGLLRRRVEALVRLGADDY